MNQPGQFTYAGAFDNAFPDYADAMRNAHPALVDPLVYQGAPDHSGLTGSGPYYGTIGVFDSHAAINAPLGFYPNEYGGNLPLNQQPKVSAPEPWDAPEMV